MLGSPEPITYRVLDSTRITMPALSYRKREILKFIGSEHVQTASPVASSTVARSTNLKASPATIRNEMVALEEDGYIHRPHVSAGGVPSDRGYRQFVASLDPDATLHPTTAARIDEELHTVQTYVEEWVNSSSEILAGLTGTLAFTTVPQSAPAPVKSVELLRLKEMLLVVILVLEEASIYKQIIQLDSPLTNSDIEHARNRLSEAIVDVPVNSLPSRVSHVETGLERLAFDSALKALKRHNNGSPTENRFSGIGKLFRQPEMIANPIMAEGATWIIEDPLAISTLDEYTDEDGTASVVIGEENTEQTLKNFSVVFSRYGTSNTAEGIIGVVAPTRMRYGAAIPSVSYIAQQLNEITTMVYG